MQYQGTVTLHVKLRKYVGQMPTYYVAIRLQLSNYNLNPNPNLSFWAKNWHTGYSCPSKRSHQLWFIYTFVSELGARIG